MTLTWCRALSPAALFLAALLPVQAQQQPPQPQQQPQAQPAQAHQNPYCSRLESQLQAFDPFDDMSNLLIRSIRTQDNNHMFLP